MKSLLTKLIVLLTPLFVLLFPSIASAQTAGLNLTTSPVAVNLVTKPGQTVTTDLKVHNNGTASEKLKVGLLKFSATGATGTPQLQEPSASDIYFNWVKFSDNQFDLAPNEWKTIRMSVVVPKDASLGYYYAVTFTRASDASNIPAGGGAKITGSSAILVLLDVRTGNEKRDLSVSSFTVDKSLWEFLPVTFSLNVHNNGNIHVVPQGDVFITREGSKDDIAVLPINQGQGNVLPNTNRVFNLSWDDGFPVYVTKVDANGKQTTQLKWDLSQASKFRWGKYQAQMLLVYNNGTRDVPVEGTVTFWVVPWKILLGALVVVLLVGIGFLAILRGLFRTVKR